MRGKAVGKVKKTWVVSSEFGKLFLGTVSRKVIDKVCIPVLIGLRKQHLNEELSETKSVEIWSNNIYGGSSIIKRVSPIGCRKGPAFQFIDG